MRAKQILKDGRPSPRRAREQSWNLVTDPSSSVLHWPELAILIYFSVVPAKTFTMSKWKRVIRFAVAALEAWLYIFSISNIADRTVDSCFSPWFSSTYLLSNFVLKRTIQTCCRWKILNCTYIRTVWGHVNNMVTKCETSKNVLDIEALRKPFLVLTTSSCSSFPFLPD